MLRAAPGNPQGPLLQDYRLPPRADPVEPAYGAPKPAHRRGQEHTGIVPCEGRLDGGPRRANRPGKPLNNIGKGPVEAAFKTPAAGGKVATRPVHIDFEMREQSGAGHIVAARHPVEPRIEAFARHGMDRQRKRLTIARRLPSAAHRPLYCGNSAAASSMSANSTRCRP